MARRRFFVNEIRDGIARLSGDDARHLVRVLRAEAGMQFEISDNQAVYLAEVAAVERDAVSLRILEPVEANRPPVCLTLLAALIKFDRFEWMIEKATELGVETVIPVNAARSEKGLAEAAVKRVERWRKIARESSQQSRRGRIPEILAAASFADSLGLPFQYRYFLEERAGAPPLLAALPDTRQSLDRVAVLCGPEGGWTDRERELSAAAGWLPVALGPHILRSETSAMAALSVISITWWNPEPFRKPLE
ncbi:MAG: RsmE family RNA methyltransferase [Bryobacteraceae bacterium]